MRASPTPARRSRGWSPAAIALALALAAACGTDVPATPGATGSPASAPPSASPTGAATPSASPTGAATPVASPTAAPTPSSVTPPPSAVPGADAALLVPGVLAVTVTDDLRVRSEPRVAAASLKYTPTLREGTDLVVIAGPVRASGYTWLKVAPLGVELRSGAKNEAVAVDQGWVAIADHDGTPWVGLADDPTPGYELASATVSRASPTLAAARDAAAAQNAFGLDLYRRVLADPELALDDKGVVLSPTSIVMALGMARAGAKGDTAAEMDAVLRLDGWDRYAAGLGALDQELRSRDATWSDCDGCPQRSLALRMANQVFGQAGFAIKPAFLERVGGTFGSPLALVDYIGDTEAARRAINGWVSRQTLGRIPELLATPDVTGDTRLVLVNAVYLKAQWVKPFADDLTVDRGFTTMAGDEVTVPTMRQVREAIPVAEGGGWRATSLAYQAPDGRALEMQLVLPDDIAALERRLTPALLARIDAALATERDRVEDVRYGNPDRWGMDCGTVDYVTNLWLPRFGIETRGNLVAALGAAGMRIPMSDAADLAGITDEVLRIGAVIHQANIDVDEEGTEAAAATAVGMDTTGGCGGPEPAEVRTLRLDRPFMYLIRDTRTGAILFLGRVADPTVR